MCNIRVEVDVSLCQVPYSSFGGGGSKVLQLSAEGALECSVDVLESNI